MLLLKSLPLEFFAKQAEKALMYFKKLQNHRFWPAEYQPEKNNLSKAVKTIEKVSKILPTI